MNMKKLFSLMLSATLFACSSPEEPGMEPDTPEQREEARFRTVTFDLQGEAADFTVEEEPLSKAGTDGVKDLYVINVRARDTAVSEYYEQYAYGTFDVREGMSLKLKEGLQYRFEVTMVKGGRNSLYWTGDSTYYWGTSSDSELLNRFVTGGWTADCYDAGQSMMCYAYGEGYEYDGSPTLDRYYGEVRDYVPVEGDRVTVNLYRVVFAVKVNVTGLTSGRLDVNMSRCPLIQMTAETVHTHEGVYQLYYLANVVDCVANGEEQSETMPLTVKWTNDAGDKTLDIYNDNITVARLKRTTVSINLTQSPATKSGGAVSVTKENINN